MSTDRDVNRIVRSWLEEGVSALPDRVLDTVLDQLPATPQRRALWPVRRFGEMNAFTKVAAAAAAVAVVAVVGINLLPGSGGVGSPGPTPTPSPSPSPTASPIPLPSSGSLEPGTYTIDDRRFTQATHFVVTVPAGWKSTDPFIVKEDGQPGEVGLTTWVVSHVHSDSCKHTTDTLVDVGSSPDKLVSALVALKNRVVSQPTDVTIGGFPAKRLELAVPAGLDVSTCTFGAIKNWPDPGPDESGGLCCGGPGFVDVVYVVDINGKSLAVVARHLPGSSSQDLAELQGIVDSIKIEP
jgi:hypothetical protein